MPSDKDIQCGFLRQDSILIWRPVHRKKPHQHSVEINSLELSWTKLITSWPSGQINERRSNRSLIIDLNDVTHHLWNIGRSTIRWTTEKVLLGLLAFKRENFDRKQRLFRWWRMRIEFGKLLLQSNDVLLLMSQQPLWILDPLYGWRTIWTLYGGVMIVIAEK